MSGSGEEPSLGHLYGALQSRLLAALEGSREVADHPGARGAASEIHWSKMLADFLPTRYRITKGFVIDLEGSTSDEIDVIIYDQQYSPLLFTDGGTNYLPAESVYGVVEVKQHLDRGTVQYAADKAASVRRLRRTSVPIPHAGGTYDPQDPKPILGAVVAHHSEWSPPLGDSLVAALTEQDEDHWVQLGCSVSDGAFEVIGKKGEPLNIRTSRPEFSVVAFCIALLIALRRVATVTALDLDAYSAGLWSE